MPYCRRASFRDAMPQKLQFLATVVFVCHGAAHARIKCYGAVNARSVMAIHQPFCSDLKYFQR